LGLHRLNRVARSLHIGVASDTAEDVVAQLRNAQIRPGLEAMAHALVDEATVLGDRSLPTDLARVVREQSHYILPSVLGPLLEGFLRC